MTKQQLTWLGLAGLAALAYCAFPLAFWLNPPYAWRGLVSQLAEPGQPYAGLFNAGDIVSSLLGSLIFGYLLIAQPRPGRWLQLALWFGLLAVLGDLASALITLPAGFPTTGFKLSAALHSPAVLLHGGVSLLNGLGFILSVGAWAYLSANWRNWRTILAICALLISTIGAGAGLLLPAAAPSLQRVFILLYGVWMVGLTYDGLVQP